MIEPHQPKLWHLLAACIIPITVCLLLLFVVQCHDDCINCGEVDVVELADDSEGVEVSTKRRLYKIWIAPGTVQGISEPDFRRRIMAGLNEISEFTAADFVLVDKMSGSHTRIYPATNAMQWQKSSSLRKSGMHALGMQNGNWIYLTVNPRWGRPEQRILEACVIHEFGHRVGIRYPKNKDKIHSPSSSDIMHWALPVYVPSVQDKIEFQRKIGKPL